VFVGTSRGGILTMLLAAHRPTAIAGCILNDIGPVIELKGVARIRGYVGKLSQPKRFEQAAEIMHKLFGAHFPALTDPDWLAFARCTFKQENGRLVANYDPGLSTALAGIDVEQPLPTLWKEFEGLARVPVLLLRGENSDLLSPATVKEMQARHPGMRVIEVPGQGHAPLLTEPGLIAEIVAFVRSCDGGSH